MTTAQEIVEDAAALILVDEANTSLEPNESAIMTRFLNDMCADLYDDDVDIGFKPVTSPSDFITSPSSVNYALKVMLAKRSSPIFGLPLDPDLRQEARKIEESLTRRYLRSVSQDYPDTLPMGSGNYDDTFLIDNFYQQQIPQAFLRLPNDGANPKVVTIANQDEWTAIGGFAVDRQKNIRSDGQSVTYQLDGAYYSIFEAVFSMAAGNDDLFTFAFAKNGAILEQSQVDARDLETFTVKVRWAEALRRNDVVNVVVKNNDNDNDLTLFSGVFRVE